MDEIKDRLDNALPCRVLSTSLVEAGVDIDFPQVYREIAGYDSIIQSAGRCNREGRYSPDTSYVTVFELEDNNEPSNFAQKIYAMRATYEDTQDFTTQESIKMYYEKLYKLRNNTNQNQKLLEQKTFDKKKILKYLCSLKFRKAASEFKLIEDEQSPVYIELLDEEGKSLNGDLLRELKSGSVSKKLMRQLNRCIVQVYPHELSKLEEMGALEKVSVGEQKVGILWRESQYDRRRGLIVEKSELHDLIL